MKAPHLRAYQFRKVEPVPGIWGGVLALIPCVTLAVLLLVGPYVTGPVLRMCTL